MKYKNKINNNTQNEEEKQEFSKKELGTLPQHKQTLTLFFFHSQTKK